MRRGLLRRFTPRICSSFVQLNSIVPKVDGEVTSKSVDEFCRTGPHIDRVSAVDHSGALSTPRCFARYAYFKNVTGACAQPNPDSPGSAVSHISGSNRVSSNARLPRTPQEVAGIWPPPRDMQKYIILK